MADRSIEDILAVIEFEQHTKATWEYDWVIDENTGVGEIIVIEDDELK